MRSDPPLHPSSYSPLPTDLPGTPRPGDFTQEQDDPARDRSRHLSESPAPEPLTQTASPDSNSQSSLLSKAPPPVSGYIDLYPLGAGSFGEVWKAKAAGTGAIVAIKFFNRGASVDWRSLLDEVKRLVQFDSIRGVVQIKDVYPDADPPYYIMAFADQGSLATHLLSEPLPLDRVKVLFSQITEALAYVHAKRICHCDLKPGNVLLDACGNALLADFGQAHLANDSSASLGTFFYMAPEQADVDRPQQADPRWDVYGLGAIAYAMLTGRAPRRNEDLERQLAEPGPLSRRLTLYRDWLIESPKPDAHRRVRGMDRDLAAIVDRCLDVDPDRRFRDAAAVLEALQRRQRLRRQRPLLVFSLLGCLVLLTALAIIGGYLRHEAVEASKHELTEQLLASNRDSAKLVARAVQTNLNSRIQEISPNLLNKLYQAVERKDEQGMEHSLQRLLGVDSDSASRKIGAVLDAPRGFTYAMTADNKGRILCVVTLHRKDGKPARIRDKDGEVEARTMPGGHLKLKNKQFSWCDWYSGQGDRLDEKEKLHPPITRQYVSDPFPSTIDGEMLFNISVPIRSSNRPDAPLIGVLAAGIALKDLNYWLLDVKMEHGGAIVLLNQKRQRLLGRSSLKPGDRWPRHDYNQLEEALAEQGRTGTIQGDTDPTAPGIEYLTGYAKMTDENLGWIALVQHKSAEALQPIEKLKAQLNFVSNWLFVLAGLFLGLVWSWLLWMLRRAEHFADA